MAEKKFVAIGGKMYRLTRLDGCGRAVYGEDSRIVTSAVVQVQATANIDEGEAVEVRNSNGDLCASRPAKQRITGYTAQITLCGASPGVVNMTTANPIVENGSGIPAGFDVDTEVDGSENGFTLEVWSDLGAGDPCGPTEATQLQYLVGLFKGGTVGDFTIENEAVNFVISGATTIRGHSWGTGPYLVDVDAEGDPVALSALSPSVALRVLAVGLNPPEASDGLIPLDDPDAPAATAATAGTPGTWTPSGAFRPEEVEDMGGVTASPTSAWTTGQYVVLQSGKFAHWSGTAWVAGKKP